MLAARHLVGDVTVAYLVLHPGCAQPSKRWPPRHWQELIHALQGDGWGIVLTGSGGDAEACAAIASGAVRCLAGKTPWDVLTAIVSGAAAVVACDTGIVHLAQAVGTPSLALFGPTDPSVWGHAEPGHRSLTQRLECSHCNLGRCPKVKADAISPCLAAIAPEAVRRELRALLAARPSSPAPGGHGLPVLPVAAAAAGGPGDRAAAWSAARR
ncbi:MAG: glycosyltransferase family 9 protein [Terriglobales bacterium]